jgi:hypothetical protein
MGLAFAPRGTPASSQGAIRGTAKKDDDDSDDNAADDVDDDDDDDDDEALTRIAGHHRPPLPLRPP